VKLNELNEGLDSVKTSDDLEIEMRTEIKAEMGADMLSMFAFS
jgi:hypothetical protein